MLADYYPNNYLQNAHPERYVLFVLATRDKKPENQGGEREHRVPFCPKKHKPETKERDTQTDAGFERL
jgi:hypothetical protein